jgi:ribA/ribD-fused uncharacterized protein
MKKRSKKAVASLTPARSSSDIRFYRANEKPYGAFSNLYKSPVDFEGHKYPTAEHAYQAGKALKLEVREWILAAPSPSLAAMAAHGLYTWDIVPNWNAIKFDRMRRVLFAKFTQHPHLRTLLVQTNDKRLVEAGSVNNAVNRLWGEVNGVGQNMLGQMLMELREAFIAEVAPAKANLAPVKTKKKSQRTRRASGQRKAKAA